MKIGNQLIHNKREIKLSNITNELTYIGDFYISVIAKNFFQKKSKCILGLLFRPNSNSKLSSHSIYFTKKKDLENNVYYFDIKSDNKCGISKNGNFNACASFQFEPQKNLDQMRIWVSFKTKENLLLCISPINDTATYNIDTLINNICNESDIDNAYQSIDILYEDNTNFKVKSEKNSKSWNYKCKNTNNISVQNCIATCEDNNKPCKNSQSNLKVNVAQIDNKIRLKHDIPNSSLIWDCDCESPIDYRKKTFQTLRKCKCLKKKIMSKSKSKKKKWKPNPLTNKYHSLNRSIIKRNVYVDEALNDAFHAWNNYSKKELPKKKKIRHSKYFSHPDASKRYSDLDLVNIKSLNEAYQNRNNYYKNENTKNNHSSSNHPLNENTKLSQNYISTKSKPLRYSKTGVDIRRPLRYYND